MFETRNGSAFKIYCGIFLFLSGCATSKDIHQLHNSITSLQKSQDALQINQADLSSQMLELHDTMLALTEQLIDSRERMSLVSQRLDDIEANFSNRMDDLSRQLSGSPQSTEPIPSEIYRIGYNDFIRARYDLASIQFRRYLERYPKGELAGKAKFYLAECSYIKDEWEDAIVQYNELIKTYPNTEFVPDALLKKGLALEKIKKRKEAKSVYQSLVDSYPNSVAADKAREFLTAPKKSAKPKEKPKKIDKSQE